MRTRTIFEAMGKAINEANWRYMPGELERRRRLRRMVDTFKAELLRRMDERDALVAPRQVFLTPERIGQYMAGFSDSMKADDILRGGK